MAASVEPGIYDYKDQGDAAKILLNEQSQAQKQAAAKKQAFIQTISSAASLSTIQEKTIPYTDEFGYRVVGGLRYGRGISVLPQTVFDGKEIKTAGERTQKDIVSAYQANMQMDNATDEGNFMKDYFTKAVYNDAMTGAKTPMEGLVPGPLKFAYESLSKEFKPSTASQANQIANMLVETSHTASTVSLVNQIFEQRFSSPNP